MNTRFLGRSWLVLEYPGRFLKVLGSFFRAMSIFWRSVHRLYMLFGMFPRALTSFGDFHVAYGGFWVGFEGSLVRPCGTSIEDASFSEKKQKSRIRKVTS